MLCPYCATDNDRVIDSRSSDGGESIRRRRECLACGRRFTTYERIEKTARLVVVKKDGTRVPFEPEKILRGILAACGKRPIPEEAKAAIVRAVEDEVVREFDREVEAIEIGKRVARRLRELDQIAYIRYASEYEKFRTLDEMAEVLEELRKEPRPGPDQQDLFESS